MKKALSLILALMLVFTTFAFGMTAFAGDDLCEFCKNPCTHSPNNCHCCVNCPYLDKNYLCDCAKYDETLGEYTFCCSECNGIWPCDCGCPCCSGQEDPNESDDPLIDPDTAKTFKEVFQDILDTLKEVFDNIFGVLFGLVGLK